MTEIKYEVKIDAPPARVWGVFEDFENYPAWNPFIVSANGQRREGANIELTIVTESGARVNFNPTIKECVDGKKIVWASGLGMPGLFDREISFLLEPTDDGKSRFSHSGKFSGLLVPLRQGRIKELEQGYRNMNNALKARCESAA